MTPAPAETVTIKTTTPISPRATADGGINKLKACLGLWFVGFLEDFIPPSLFPLSLPSQGIHSARPCTCLDSIFRGQIEIWLWRLPRDGGILPDPSWFRRFERWQEFALSSGAVGREDHWRMTDAWRVGARAGGPQWGGSAGGPGTVFIARHRDPSELQSRSGYMADTGAAGRAGQGSFCGR